MSEAAPARPRVRDDSAVDAVSIVVPTQRHYEVAKFFLPFFRSPTSICSSVFVALS